MSTQAEMRRPCDMETPFLHLSRGVWSSESPRILEPLIAPQLRQSICESLMPLGASTEGFGPFIVTLGVQSIGFVLALAVLASYLQRTLGAHTV